MISISPNMSKPFHQNVLSIDFGIFWSCSPWILHRLSSLQFPLPTTFGLQHELPHRRHQKLHLGHGCLKGKTCNNLRSLKIKLQDPTISYNLEESSFKIQKLNDAFLMKFGIVWGHSNFKSTVLSMIYADLCNAGSWISKRTEDETWGWWPRPSPANSRSVVVPHVTLIRSQGLTLLIRTTWTLQVCQTVGVSNSSTIPSSSHSFLETHDRWPI